MSGQVSVGEEGGRGGGGEWRRGREMKAGERGVEVVEESEVEERREEVVGQVGAGVWQFWQDGKAVP